MCDVQKHITDAYRYLKMTANELKEHTPSDYLAMLRGAIEARYDEYERMAYEAMMMRAAYHKEKLRQSDLFKRPTGEIKTDKTAEDIEERQRAIIERLSKFEQFAGKFGGKEETNG